MNKRYFTHLSNGKLREYLIIKEQKTSKEKKIKINEALQKELSNYIKCHSLSHEDYLFPSQKGGHIGRVQSYRFLKEAAETVGIENFGTHSLRKTWGYWTYKLSKYNIGLIMDTFNHSNQQITLRYIGINQDQKDELYSLVQF
jgi:integrase